MKKSGIIFLVIIISILGYLLGTKRKSSFIMPEVKTITLPSSSSEIKPIIIESNCAKVGERSVSNFDMRTGKINTTIKNINCCPGLKNIAEKQPSINKNLDACAQSAGSSYNLCSPCGNSICDSQYEDLCNCPEDCK